MPTPKTQKNIVDDTSKHSPVGHMGERSTRGSVSNENNILLDPDILTDYPTQALLLTVLVSSGAQRMTEFSVSITHYQRNGLLGLHDRH